MQELSTTPVEGDKMGNETYSIRNHACPKCLFFKIIIDIQYSLYLCVCMNSQVKKGLDGLCKKVEKTLCDEENLFQVSDLCAGLRINKGEDNSLILYWGILQSKC